MLSTNMLVESGGRFDGIRMEPALVCFWKMQLTAAFVYVVEIILERKRQFVGGRESLL